MTQDHLQDIEQELILADNKRKYEKWINVHAVMGILTFFVACYFRWWYIGWILLPHSIAYKYYYRRKYPFKQEHLKK